jgi:cobalt-zinc-cadmium efflux system outer membrane protein
MRKPEVTSMRHLLAANIAIAALLAPSSARPAEVPSGAATFALPTDPTLARLIDESVAARPELRRAESAVRAEGERISQAGALPDPVLTLGIQNDGFKEINIGKMETSWWQIMVTQPLPWPGKRDLREGVARLGCDEAKAALNRARFTSEADVRRAYTDLLSARDRLALLLQLEGIWQTSAGVARARYESGEGTQSDVLRAQLELNRLRQRRWALEAQERTAVQTLNRLRGRPVDEAIETTASLRGAELPALPPDDVAVSDALDRSPELALARLDAERASTSTALARKERYPDLAVQAGIMPRGGLEPMWLAAVSIGLPVWSSRKQGRAVAESEAREDSSKRTAEAVEQVLRLRVAERRAVYAALLENVRIFREGLLVQSRATSESTLAQYRVGKVTFASVLEANAGYIADEESHLAAVADTLRIAIAAAEISLDPVGAPGASGGMASGGIPGAGASGGTSGSAASSSGARGAEAAPSGGGMASGM